MALGPAANAAAFVAAAIVVWVAGATITRRAETISLRFGLSQATAGIAILAGVTSLPEIATSFSAAVTGEAALAVNDLLGSIAVQVALLALADLVFDRRALTSIVPEPRMLLQGALNVVLLASVAVAVLYTDRLVLGAGLWTWSLAAVAAYGIRMLTHDEGRRPWIPGGDSPADGNGRSASGPGSASSGCAVGARGAGQVDRAGDSESTAALLSGTAVAAAGILVGGYVVAATGAALARQTGLGPSFMGVAFVALATSLPELSTVFAAMRRRLYTMAISDIFGTNVLNVALLFGIDLLAPGAPVLTRVGPFAAVGALIGVVVTGLFTMGIAERRDRTLWRMGLDSAAVLVVYAGGLVMLFTLRGSAV